MRVRRYSYPLGILAGFVVTVVAINQFYHSASYDAFFAWASEHPLILLAALVVIKIVGILWPPIPGLVFSLATVPILGWIPTLLADSIGNIIGSVAAYWAARTWGVPFLRKIFDEAMIERLQRLRVVRKREIEIIIVTRLLGSTISEGFSYGAGLVRVTFRNFLIGLIISNFILHVPIFYLADLVIQGGDYILIITIAVMIVAALFVFRIRRRYFTGLKGDV